MTGFSLPEASDETRADQALVLRVGGMDWAVSAPAVQTVFRPGLLTPVPLAPSAVAGLLNLRGRVVLAIGLSHRLFGFEAAAPTMGVAVEEGDDVCALLVESVGDVITLPVDSRIPTPPHLPATLAHLTTAVFRTDFGIVPLLDLAAVLDINADRRSGSDRRIPSSSLKEATHDAYAAG